LGSLKLGGKRKSQKSQGRPQPKVWGPGGKTGKRLRPRAADSKNGVPAKKPAVAQKPNPWA